MAGAPVVVRAGDLDAVAAIERRFASRLVPHPDADAAISWSTSRMEDGFRTAHELHRDGWPVRRTFSGDEALVTIERLLHTYLPVPAGTAWMHVRALERDGAVVLVSDAFRDALDGHRRRLARVGFHDSWYAPVLVDPESAEALLADGSLDAPEWRRVPIESVVAFAPAEDVESAASRVTHFTPLVVGRGRPTNAADVRALVALMDRVPFLRFDFTQHRQVAEALVALTTG